MYHKLIFYFNNKRGREDDELHYYMNLVLILME
jgi:hypothetical protein